MSTPSLHQLLIYLCLSLAETFILHRLLTAFLYRNKVLVRYYRQSLAAYFVFQMFSYVMSAPLFSTAALYFVFTLAISSCFFVDNMQMKATVSSLFVVLNYACKVFAAAGLYLATSRPMPPLPQDLVLGWFAQITACLLFWSSIFIIIGFRRLRINRHQFTYTLITYVVPIGILFIVMRLFRHSAGVNVLMLYLDAAGLLFCAALALFYLLDKSVVIDQTHEQQLIAAQLLITQKKYYQHLEQFQKEIQSIRHDIKNHMKCVLAMLERDETAEARDYLTKMYDYAASLESPIHCGNTVIDVVLGHGISGIRSLGFAYDINVIVPPALSIDDLDLCTLFGNLMDNAVEACSRITDPAARRYIDISASVKKGYLFVIISNTFNGEVRLENNIYQTVKTGERYSGIGLSNVRRVVERYSGDISIRHKDNVFTVSAMLVCADLPKTEPQK